MARSRICSAIILGYNGLCDVDSFIYAHIDSILNSNQKALEKVKNRTYRDLAWFDDGSALTKEGVLNLISAFSKSALENENRKIFVVKNLENASTIVQNNLLKLLEEPPGKEIYAIFTTHNPAGILVTVQSRCARVNSYTVDYEIDEILDELDVQNKELRNLIPKFYYDIDKLKRDLESGALEKALKLWKSIQTNKSKYDVLNSLADEFKKMDYYTIEMILNIEFSHSKDQYILKAIHNLKSNPSKTLLFNLLTQ